MEKHCLIAILPKILRYLQWDGLDERCEAEAGNNRQKKYGFVQSMYISMGDRIYTLCRVCIYQWGTELLLCVGISNAFGSALTTLIKKISADSGE